MREEPLESRDSEGRTPLQRAAAAGDHAEMRRLLAAGADPDSSREPPFGGLRSFWGLEGGLRARSSPAELRARACDIEGLDMLIAAGASELGLAAYGAIRQDCEPALRRLLSGGVLPGWAPPALYEALEDGSPRMARVLLEAGAARPPHPPDLFVPLGRCEPIWRNAAGGLPPGLEDELVEFVELLTEYGADPNLPDGRWNLTPLDWAAEVCDSPALVGALRDVGATVEGGPDAAVRAALVVGNIEQLRRAFAAGGSPQQTLPDGTTLLRRVGRNELLAEELRTALARSASATATPSP